MLHTTAQERYQKLRNVFTRLKSNFNRDDLDDFIQTANSLREWIRHDATVTPEQKSHLERFVVPESVDWQICNQIANQQEACRSCKSAYKKRESAAWRHRTGCAGQPGWDRIPSSAFNANYWRGRRNYDRSQWSPRICARVRNQDLPPLPLHLRGGAHSAWSAHSCEPQRRHFELTAARCRHLFYSAFTSRAAFGL